MKIDYAQKDARFVKATKTLVDELLALNTNNRSQKKSHTVWLKKAIASGNFVLTGQAITISKDGELIDGQHRLMAIRDCGYPPVEFLLVTGVDKKAKAYVDQHTKRSVADMLKVVVDRSVSSKSAQLVNTHLKLRVGQTGEFTLRNDKPAIDDIIKTTEKYQDWIGEIISAGGQKMRAGMLTALLHYAIKYDLDTALELANKAKHGEKLVKNEPAFKLRQLMYDRSTGGGTATVLNDYKVTVTLCIADALGKPIENLRATNSWDRLPAKPKQVFLKSDAGKPLKNA